MARKLLLAGLLTLGVSHISGCIFWGGSDKVSTPTEGQQLMDLQTARNKGAISEEEYAQKKAAILSQQEEKTARTASFNSKSHSKPGAR